MSSTSNLYLSVSMFFNDSRWDSIMNKCILNWFDYILERQLGAEDVLLSVYSILLNQTDLLFK